MNKKLLLGSVLTALVCGTMIAGTTYALFTDEANTNIAIEAGNVDINAEIKDLELHSPTSIGTDGVVVDNTNAATTDTFANGGTATLAGSELTLSKIAPGDSVKFNIVISNKSNIKVQYRTLIKLVEGETLFAGLNAKVGGTSYTFMPQYSKWASLDVNSADIVIPVEIELPASADNQYKGLSAKLSFAVEAVQGNAYVEDYLAANTQESLNDVLADATIPTVLALEDGTYNILLKDGSTANLVNKDITFTGDKDAVMDLIGIVGATWHTQDTGANITFDGVTIKWNEDNEGYQGFANANKVVYKNCTIYGTQFMGGDADFINCVFEAADTKELGYAVYGRGAGTLNFTDCTFNTSGRAIMLYQDQTTDITVNVENCVFNDNGKYTSKAKAAVETGDGSYKTSKFNITITDCKAYGFEANGSDSVFWGNKDAIDGSRLSVTMNGTNVAGKFVVVDDNTSLNDAVADSDDVSVTLPKGEYTLPSVTDKNVIISGGKDTVIDATTITGNTSGADLTFEGITLKFDNDNYEGFTHASKVLYKDCTIIGTMFLYSNTEFINCTFEKYSATTEYNVWTYGSNATFTGCTFNSSGKAILVYNESEMHATVTVNNCVFNDDGTYSDKAAIEVGSSPYSADTTYKLVLNDCVVNGFDVNPAGISTGSTLWGNKNSMDQEHLNVILNDVDVY